MVQLVCASVSDCDGPWGCPFVIYRVLFPIAVGYNGVRLVSTECYFAQVVNSPMPTKTNFCHHTPNLFEVICQCVFGIDTLAAKTFVKVWWSYLRIMMFFV